MLIPASILFKDRPSVPSRLYSYYTVSNANTLYSQHRVKFREKLIFAYSAIPLFRVLQTPFEEWYAEQVFINSAKAPIKVPFEYDEACWGPVD